MEKGFCCFDALQVFGCWYFVSKYFSVCDVFPNVWKEEEVKIAASIRYFIAQEQTGTIWKLHSCGKCPNSQILQKMKYKKYKIFNSYGMSQLTNITKLGLS